MPDLYGHIAHSDPEEGDQGSHEKEEEKGLHLEMPGFTGVGIEGRQNERFIQTYLVSSEGQMLCEPQMSISMESEVLFSPSSTSSQRNPVTPTLKVEDSDGDTWAHLMEPSRAEVEDAGASLHLQSRSYLGAFSAEHELNDMYRSDAETGYASSSYHTPGLYPVDPAVSPAVSYLTIGDEELDDLLSVHSGTSAYSNISLPMSASGFRHVTNVDELDNLLSASSGRFDENFSEFVQSSVTACEEQQGSRIPPVISVQEFQEKRSDEAGTSVSSTTFDEQNFQRAEQKLNASLLCPNDMDVEHEDMINGRIARRRASHGSRRSRSSVRSRSLSPDERARSLSEDRDRLLLLADLQPPSPNDLQNRSASPLGDGETLQNLSGNTKRRLSQKNPATYACELCDKKFTRPYNLKSHLRTHTNERPFICSSCGKAFARQHDRKRHEDLHTGKKRYVCGGKLKDGTPWGCGKKFARSDALGRHFKTESGKKCITPLYDEAARNKQTLEADFQQD
ncbi:hypothetical protein HG536_0A02150 [Torulaspora globosa]|uniref:C2H2-type domain-containing protein n=1 Tax=Torulaspora globosa TaxID=48254 RepID=A0A7G3ZA62_9SACH|nr:uncharacterized protein HG536_0A02150 [Torulaspora globosa]QLL30398.1 hypothetical protein HG536_0A02150 [Torulaspora globosa]